MGALATSNYGAAITSAAGAYGAYQASQARYNTQAAQDAENDILRGLYQGLKLWDAYWDQFANAAPVQKLTMRAQAEAQPAATSHAAVMVSTVNVSSAAHTMTLDHHINV